MLGGGGGGGGRRRSSRKALLTRALLAFCAINFLSLLVFLLHHTKSPSPPEHHHNTPSTDHQGPSPLKPWPRLPSFLPWVDSAHRPELRSCEAYFGNSFTQLVDVIPPPEGGDDGGGWFRCFYSGTLRSSICEGGSIRMDPARISMARGGERLDDVIGRGEEEELPSFGDGAFEIEGTGGGKLVDGDFLNEFIPQGAIGHHTMRDLVGSLRVVGRGKLECSQWIDNPTLLVTRFEYANLFHTVTDWYSAYVSSRVTNLPGRPDLVFVDGHCKAPLEQTWEALFSSLAYAKNFTSPVCFRHAILSPLGYETAMFKGLTESFSCKGASAHQLLNNPDDQKTARLSEFGEMLRAAFGLPVDDTEIRRPVSGHNVLFVRREDYLAHPRHNGKVQSRLSNEQDVFDSLKVWAADYTKCKINLVNGLFAHMPMKDQLQAILEASVVIGAHGAGLTHLVVAAQNTVVLEIISSAYRRPHFELISRWKGLDYHAINLAGSHAEPAVVINELRSIMQTLGC